MSILFFSSPGSLGRHDATALDSLGTAIPICRAFLKVERDSAYKLKRAQEYAAEVRQRRGFKVVRTS